MDYRTHYKVIYEAIKTIPCGKVITFQKLAYKIGSAIITSNKILAAIKHHPNPTEDNTHRVVCSDGNLSNAYPLGGVEAQKIKLE